MDHIHAQELGRRLAAALRATELYAPAHPVVQRGTDALHEAVAAGLQTGSNITVGFAGDDVVVNGTRVARGTAALAGMVRGLRERQIERITIARGISLDEIRRFVVELGDLSSPMPLRDRIATRVGSHVVVGPTAVDENCVGDQSIAAARKAYASAVETAEVLWNAAKAGECPDPGPARQIVNRLAALVSANRTSVVALTEFRKNDNYTFTHMVNVSVLAMAQARALNIEGPLLREFGLAALLHDIGKVNTPVEVLNKPGKLTKDEFEIMKRHVVDGAHILRRTPEMPSLAPIVAFEHHLKQDLSGYPENVGSRTLNLCTMIVSIADVFDALRSHRPYRQGLATSRIRTIMGEQGNPAFNQVLLKRFVNLMGLFPVGTLVRLSTEELAVVVAEHPSDPFHPQVKVITTSAGEMIDAPPLVKTWRHDGQPHPRSVVEAIDPDEVRIDPLKYL
jgi:putative nucleotidyltransferase with HDIG domain